MTWKRFFESKLFFVAGIGVLALFSVNLTRAQLKDRTIRAEIQKSQDEVDALLRERSHYEELQTMLNTSEFLEKEARKTLGYAKPGEQVVVIEDKGAQQGAQDQQDKEMSNPKKWWVYFFGKI